MSRGSALSAGGAEADEADGPVPAPIPPDDGGAWYAPDVRAQYEVAPGVVTTVRDDAEGVGFAYDVREPGLGPHEEEALSAIRAHFSVVNRRRPLTREGTAERAAEGVPPKYRRVFDRILDASPAARRRVEYYALCELRLLGEVTPLALDDRIDVVDVSNEDESGALVVHTENYAPAVTDYRTDAEFADRIAGERLRHYTVPFCGFDVDVVVHRDHLLGDDRFTTKYAVLEPDLLPGDEELIDECKERIWEANVGEVVEDRRAFVAERARQFLSRRLTARNTRAWVEATEYRLRTALAEYGLAVPPVDRRFAEDRLDDLVYYVLRDYVGEGVLTVPIRDPNLEDVEANRVGERVKVIPRAGVGDVPNSRSEFAGSKDASRLSNVAEGTSAAHQTQSGDVDETQGVSSANRNAKRSGDVAEETSAGRQTGSVDGNRVPTNLAFEDETSFVNVVTQLAAADGVELNASRPSAKVNYRPEDRRGGVEGGGLGDGAGDGDTETIRCAVALPVISEGGPHVSIRKQSADPLTPVDLVELGSIPTELVALLWMLYEHHRVVLFSGATGVGKTTLMNAHMPFIPYDHRPVSIDEGSREVHLPHETGVSLTTRDHENEFKRVSMADLMTEANYLNPDVEVIAEVNTPASFETFAEVLNTGHGVIGTTHAEDVETLVNRVIEQGLPAYLLRELDLVVFPRRIDGTRYVGEVIELVDESGYDALPASARKGVIEKDGRVLRWNTVLRRETDGTFSMQYDHPRMGDDHRRLSHRVFHRIAAATDREVEAVEAEFHRKHGYVQYFVKEGVGDFDRLFAFLSDLRTDEAATVERVRRRMADGRSADVGGDEGDARE